MKKMMKLFGFIAVAAMSLTACQNDIDEQVNVNNVGVTLEVVADMGTRSYFGEKEDAGYPSTWTGNEKVQFAANDGTGFTVTNTESGATTHLSATFTTGTTTNDGVIFAMSPVGDYENGKGGWGSYSWSYGNVYLTIPAVQTPIEQSVDEAAHILFAEHNYEGAFPTGTIGMEFKHALAYGKMTLTLPEGVEASQVILHFPVAVAGNSVKRYIKEYTDDEKTYQPGEFTGADQKTITLNAGNVVDGVYWFGLLPIGLVTEDMNIEVVATNGDIYKKTIAVGGNLEFNQGRVSAFKVTMAAVAPVAYEYALISNISELTDGSEVIIVGKTTTKTAALGAANGSSSAPGLDEVTLVDNTVDMSTVLTTSILTVTKTDAGYKFGNGSAYLYATNTNNGVRFGTNANNVFTVSTHGSNSDAFMMKNNTTSRYIGIYNNQDWRCYTTYNAGNYTAAAGTSELYIYKKGIAAVDNRKSQTLTFSESEVTITMGETFNAPTLSGLETTATWESSNEDVATVAAATGVVSIVGPGTTIIKVTAAENEEYKAATASYTLVVEQKTIEKLTVAEFLEKEVNNAVYYELTGTISNIKSTQFGNFDLTDETGTVYIYGLTEEKVDNNDQSFSNIGLVDGDQVTIHTCRAAYGTTPQGGGTPPAYYVDHVVNNTSRIISISPSALTFTHDATNAQNVTVTVAGATTTLSATASETWVTATASGNTFSVSVEENTVEESREATLTITYGDSSKTVTISQNAKPAEGAPAETTVIFNTSAATSNPFTLNGSGTTGTLDASVDGINIKITKENSTSNCALYSPLRFYQNHKMTFTSEKKITKIVFNYDTGKTPTALTIKTGSGTFTGPTNNVGTYTGTGETTIAFVAPAQVRFKSIEVTYAE